MTQPVEYMRANMNLAKLGKMQKNCLRQAQMRTISSPKWQRVALLFLAQGLLSLKTVPGIIEMSANCLMKWGRLFEFD